LIYYSLNLALVFFIISPVSFCLQYVGLMMRHCREIDFLAKQFAIRFSRAALVVPCCSINQVMYFAYVCYAARRADGKIKRQWKIKNTHVEARSACVPATSGLKWIQRAALEVPRHCLVNIGEPSGYTPAAQA